jgi:hypothetical protein
MTKEAAIIKENTYTKIYPKNAEYNTKPKALPAYVKTNDQTDRKHIIS